MATVLNKCSRLEGHTLEKFVKACILWLGLNAKAEEEHKEEKVAEMKHYECVMNLYVLTFTHKLLIIFSPHTLLVKGE